MGGSLGVTVLVAAGESLVAVPVPPDVFSWVTTQPLSQSSWSEPFALASPDQLQVAIASGTLPASAGWSGFHINHVLKVSMAWTRSAIPATGWPGLSSDLNSTGPDEETCCWSTGSCLSIQYPSVFRRMSLPLFRWRVRHISVSWTYCKVPVQPAGTSTFAVNVAPFAVPGAPNINSHRPLTSLTPTEPVMSTFSDLKVGKHGFAAVLGGSSLVLGGG